MNNKNVYTQEELDILRQMKAEGAKTKAIAELLGRSVSSIDNKWYQLRAMDKATEQPKEQRLVKIPKLEDFSPREMIKHLYNLGYRIEDNRLVLVRKDYVNIKSIIEEAH